MANKNLTADQIFQLNNYFGRAGYDLQLGTLLSGFAMTPAAGQILINGGFLTAGAHGAPAATFGTGFTITPDTTDGAYKIQLGSDYVGKTILGITGSVGVGVAYNGGAPDCSGNGCGAIVDCVCINSNTGEIWVRTVSADTTFAPTHIANAVVSFYITVK